MQTFLPSGYSFSPDKLIDKQVYQFITNSDKYYIYIALMGICAIIAIIAILAITCLNHYKKDISTPTIVLAVIIFVSSIIIAICAFRIKYYRPDNQMATYKTSKFICSNKGNLYIQPVDNNTPKNLNDRRRYPYKIYFKAIRNEKDSDDNVCLGTMRNAKFTPENNKYATVFYQYYKYMCKHNLNQKFIKNAYFIRDSKYVSNNESPQWVLTNKKDVTLHLSNNYHVEQSKVVK